MNDSLLAVAVDAVVLPNGAGSWTRDASWDEYRFRVRSLTGGELRLGRITVIDALGQAVEAGTSRAKLVEATGEVRERYAAAGLPTAPTSRGQGFPVLPGPWAVGLAMVFVGSMAHVAYEMQVDRHIKARHTPLPVAIGPGDSTVVAFFPIVLRPAAIELSYVQGATERRVRLDPREALLRVRESPIAQALHRPEPRVRGDYYFTRHGPDGRVKARLLLDARGNVVGVDILESSSPAYVEEAKRTFARYRYNEGAGGRTVEETMPFKHGR